MWTTTRGSDMHIYVFAFSRSLARSCTLFLSLSLSLSAAAHGVMASPTTHASIAGNSPRSHRRGRKSPLPPPEMTLDELLHAKEQESEDKAGHFVESGAATADADAAAKP